MLYHLLNCGTLDCTDTDIVVSLFRLAVFILFVPIFILIQTVAVIIVYVYVYVHSDIFPSLFLYHVGESPSYILCDTCNDDMKLDDRHIHPLETIPSDWALYRSTVFPQCISTNHCNNPIRYVHQYNRERPRT